MAKDQASLQLPSLSPRGRYRDRMDFLSSELSSEAMAALMIHLETSNEETNEEAGERVRGLFAQDDDSDDDDLPLVTETINDIEFIVGCAPDDGTSPGTLFAYTVWSGSKQIARHLAANPDMVRSKSVVELGAACALPSLLALALEARSVVVTDYPDEPILRAIVDNVERNRAVLGPSVNERLAVVGHLWGSDPAPVLAPLHRRLADDGASCSSASSSSSSSKLVPTNMEVPALLEQRSPPAAAPDVPELSEAEGSHPLPPPPSGSSTPLAHEGPEAETELFDVALVSECLWNHPQHEALCASIYRLLCPGGVALVS